MLLFWKVRYLDSADKGFKDRELWLDTDSLDPVTRAAVEATYALKDAGRKRDMLRYRHLFHGKRLTDEEVQVASRKSNGWDIVFIVDYFEDEAGQELTHKGMAVTLTGDPQAILFPPGTKQHEIEYCLAEDRTIDLDQVKLTQDQLNVLGYFARDLRELLASAFSKDSPGTLQLPGSIGRHALETAASDEEIRSFVTIFRRLYMGGEPANFAKGAAVFAEALNGYPLANLVQGIVTQYENELQAQVHTFPAIAGGTLPFTRKRLIDVFLYTQYAHQPSEDRTRQFNNCLTAVGQDRALLTWLFLTELWKCFVHIHNAGAIMADFYDHYRRCHGVTGAVLPSVRSDQPGLGVLEKKEGREARVLREKAEQLAKELWEREGRPPGGHAPFVKPALDQLMAVTGRAESRRDLNLRLAPIPGKAPPAPHIDVRGDQAGDRL
ncbi:MAG: hypothetical protein WA746_20975 [Isosphaeraceae bacterium]